MGQQFDQDRPDQALGPTALTLQIPSRESDHRGFRTRADERDPGGDPTGEPDRARAAPRGRKGDAFLDIEQPAVAAALAPSPQMQEPVIGAAGDGGRRQVERQEHIDHVEEGIAVIEGVVIHEEGFGVRERVLEEASVLVWRAVDGTGLKGQPALGIDTQVGPARTGPLGVSHGVPRQAGRTVLLLERNQSVETGIGGTPGQRCVRSWAPGAG